MLLTRFLTFSITFYLVVFIYVKSEYTLSRNRICEIHDQRESEALKRIQLDSAYSILKPDFTQCNFFMFS